MCVCVHGTVQRVGALGPDLHMSCRAVARPSARHEDSGGGGGGAGGREWLEAKGI